MKDEDEGFRIFNFVTRRLHLILNVNFNEIVGSANSIKVMNYLLKQ